MVPYFPYWPLNLPPTYLPTGACPQAAAWTERCW